MAYFLFLIYVVTTLFLGTSVKQFLGMGGDVGFFQPFIIILCHFFYCLRLLDETR